MDKNKFLTIVIISVVGVALLILFINILSSDDKGENEVVTTSSVDVVGQTEPVINEPIIEEEIDENVEENLVGDNVYSAFIEYLVPKGFQDSITVNMELEDGVVVDVDIEQLDSNPESTFYQEQFALQYEEGVIGKKIEEIDLSRVGGASLTTIAFMDAVDEIISQM